MLNGWAEETRNLFWVPRRRGAEAMGWNDIVTGGIRGAVLDGEK